MLGVKYNTLCPANTVMPRHNISHQVIAGHAMSFHVTSCQGIAKA